MGQRRIELPIACSLEGHAFDARAMDWGQVLGEVVDRRQIQGGIELHLPATAERSRLQALVEQEQGCCPWMSMQIDGSSGDLKLSISSDEPSGERQILDWFG